MDNFRIDITCEGKEALLHAFRLFSFERQQKVVGYRVDRGKLSSTRLIYYWMESTNMTPLPFVMSLEQAAEFAWGWLEKADRGVEPDHDGSNGDGGWRLYNEAWGHVGDDSRAFVAIEPVWAWYGK